MDESCHFARKHFPVSFIPAFFSVLPFPLSFFSSFLLGGHKSKKGKKRRENQVERKEGRKQPSGSSGKPFQTKERRKEAKHKTNPDPATNEPSKQPSKRRSTTRTAPFLPAPSLLRCAKKRKERRVIRKATDAWRLTDRERIGRDTDCQWKKGAKKGRKEDERKANRRRGVSPPSPLPSLWL